MGKAMELQHLSTAPPAPSSFIIPIVIVAMCLGACRRVPTLQPRVVTASPATSSLATTVLTRSVDADAPTQVAVTLPPPLAKVEFPAQPSDYPQEWLVATKYPEQFIVVEATLGTPADRDSDLWAANVRYAGEARSAVATLSSFSLRRDGEWFKRHALLQRASSCSLSRRPTQELGLPSSTRT